MAYNLDTLRNKRGVIPPMAMKMDEVDPKKLRKKKRELIREQRGLKRSGEITKEQFKEAKKEIKKYTDY